MRGPGRLVDSEKQPQLQHPRLQEQLSTQVGARFQVAAGAVPEEQQVEHHQRIEEERQPRRVPEQLAADAAQDGPTEPFESSAHEGIYRAPLARGRGEQRKFFFEGGAIHLAARTSKQRRSSMCQSTGCPNGTPHSTQRGPSATRVKQAGQTMVSSLCLAAAAAGASVYLARRRPQESQTAPAAAAPHQGQVPVSCGFSVRGSRSCSRPSSSSTLPALQKDGTLSSDSSWVRST